MTAEELKAKRAELGVSQQALADKLGVQRNTVTRWEMGIRPISELAVRLLRTLRPRKSSPRRLS